jgi:prevent-host-death family protein
MQTWQIQTAKARFSELVKQAAADGPQDITLHGRSVAVVLSRELFDRLSGNAGSLVDFMQQSPLCGQDDLEFERDASLVARKERSGFRVPGLRFAASRLPHVSSFGAGCG